MKNISSIFLAIVLTSLIIVGCGLQAQPTVTPTITLESTVNIKPTATFLPTFTPAPLFLLPLLTATLTPEPKDIFDNFQGLSGNCKVKTINETTSNGEELLALYRANVSINFDRQIYFSGDPIRLSASIKEDYDQPKLLQGIVVKVVAEEPTLKRYSLNLYDDGSHGDKKADDGTYANTFDHTLNTGIYKFYFQLSGHNKNTGKTFTKECFLGKTINPTLASGGESQSCGRIEASTPIVVRAEDVGGSDSSELGRHAFYPKAISMGTNVLATWFTGFDGQSPKPNAYMRLLDFNANPIGEVKLLFERNWKSFSSSLVKKDNFAILTYCGRYKVGMYYEDRITSAFIDSSGNLVSEQARSPTNLGCSYAGGEAVWTGSHMLFTWANVSSYNQYLNHDLLLDIADTNGESISWKLVSSDVMTNPHLAIGHDHMLSVVTNGTGQLAVYRFDLEGNEMGKPVLLSPLTYEVNGIIVTGKFQTPYIFPSTNGWMILAALEPSGIYMAHLTPEGMVVPEPFVTNNNFRFVNGFDDVFSYKDGAAIFGENKVLFLSGNGIVYQEWHPEEGELPISGSFFEHQGRLYFIYTSETNNGKPYANQVLVRELQCSP